MYFQIPKNAEQRVIHSKKHAPSRPGMFKPSIWRYLLNIYILSYLFFLDYKVFYIVRIKPEMIPNQ